MEVASLEEANSSASAHVPQQIEFAVSKELNVALVEFTNVLNKPTFALVQSDRAHLDGAASHMNQGLVQMFSKEQRLEVPELEVLKLAPLDGNPKLLQFFRDPGGVSIY